MKNKLISSLLFFIFCVTFLHGQANLPPDEHECDIPSSTEEEHKEEPSFTVSVSEGGPYDISDLDFIDIDISGSAEDIVKGYHEITTTYGVCSCGATLPPYVTPKWMPISPLKYDWSFAGEADDGSGDSFEETVRVTEPAKYTLTANFRGENDECYACRYAESATSDYWVFRLKFEGCTKWLGLDRTDDGEAIKKGEASVKLEPTPGEVEYDWSGGDPCELKNIVENEAEFWTQNTEDCSGSFDGSTLTVSVSGQDPVFSGVVETNFTVVKVDVILGGLGEDKEEKNGGALFEYIPDDVDENTGESILSEEGKNEMKSVTITCEPTDMPSEEEVTVTAPDGFLYEKIDGEYVEISSGSKYKVCELSSKQFYFHAHASTKDAFITVEHKTSKAIDRAKFSVFDVVKMGNHLRLKHCLTFGRQGGVLSGLQLSPDPGTLECTWELTGMPEGGTEIWWSNGTQEELEVGSGSSVDLSVEYVQNSGDPDDKSPPDNRWFGTKEIVVSIGDKLTIKRPITSCFDGLYESKLLNGDSVSFWYYYYITENTVNGLSDFEYYDDLGGDKALHEEGDLLIARIAIQGPARAKVINRQFVNMTYEKVPSFVGDGCHGIAKLCEHERWHKTFYEELVTIITTLPLGTIVYDVINDKDGDGLPDAREAEFNSDPDDKDTFGMCDYPEFLHYASYADNEVICRLKQDGGIGDVYAVLGDEAAGWYLFGPQVEKRIWEVVK